MKNYDSDIVGWYTRGGKRVPIRQSEKTSKEPKNPKERQLEIIQKHNPKDSELNAMATWIESVDDIKTWEEAMNDDEYNGGDVTPDFTWSDAQKAQKDGFVVVYSSKPIGLGSFVTPSKMLAESYGNKNPYSKKVKLEEVAWIDLSEGQFTGK